MVSSIATHYSGVDARGRPFRRRRFVPALVALGVLAVAATIAWSVVLTRPAQVALAAPCNPPPAGEAGAAAPPFEQVARTTMVDVAPAPLAAARVRVLNASGAGGAAAGAAASLRETGFPPPDAENDPVYASSPLRCVGQIRFGPTGQAAAAAVWLVAPCAELVSDGRADDTVDLAIGTDFESLTTDGAVATALDALRPGGPGAADPAVVAQVHAAGC